jgi:hypothetical protein
MDLIMAHVREFWIAALRRNVLPVAMLCGVHTVFAQRVTEIPFFNAPPGTAALGGGLRLGQDTYRATDNDEQRQYDLVALYLYNGAWLFARGTMGGVNWSWQDDRITGYYYSVIPDGVAPDRPEYTPGRAEWLYYGLNTSYWISDRIAFFASVGFGGIDTSVTDSPLTEEDTGSAVFMGGTVGEPTYSATCATRTAISRRSGFPNGGTSARASTQTHALPA